MLDQSVATSVTFSEEAPFHVSGCATVRVTDIGSHYATLLIRRFQQMMLRFESDVLQLQLSIFGLFTYETTNSHRYAIHSDAMLEHEFNYKKICLFLMFMGPCIVIIF